MAVWVVSIALIVGFSLFLYLEWKLLEETKRKNRERW